MNPNDNLSNIDSLKPPKLVRSTHKVCNNLECTRNVSEYDHNLCYKCCYPGTIEYQYHNLSN